MRIALLNPVPFYGGGEKRTLAMARGFESAGHSVMLFVHPRGSLVGSCERLGLRSSPLRLRRTFSPLAAGRLSRSLAAAGVETAVAYTERALLHLTCAAATLRPRPRVIYYYSGSGMLTPSVLSRLLLPGRVDAYVANAASTLAELQSLSWLGPAQRRAIADGVEPPPGDGTRESVRASLGAGAEAVVVLLAGRLIPLKRHAAFLEAIAEDLRADPHLHVWIAGVGPEGDRLDRLATERGEGRVRVLGFRSDVPQLMAAADLLCHPSEREGAPNAVREAMAAGLPVVATAAHGTAELVQDGVTGCLLPVSDMSGVAAAVRRLAADRDRRTAMGQAAQRVAREAFSEERCISQWLALFECLGGR